MDAVRTETLGDLTINIIQDESVESPRTSYDNLGTLWISQRDRNIDGDKDAGSEFTFRVDSFRRADELFTAMERERPGVVILCVNAYVHSGVHVWASDRPETSPFDAQGWDSGMCGVIYVTAERIAEEGVEASNIPKYLTNEIKTLDQWFSGDVYGYVIKTDKGEALDSCWGFYGVEDALEEARSSAQWHVDERKIEAALWEQEHRGMVDVEYALVA